MLREPKRDCFAFQRDGHVEKCTALDELYCRYGKKSCKFYKASAEMKDYKFNKKEKG